MAKLLNVSSSPHVRSSLTTHKIMYQVILSLMPVTIMGIINYKMGALSVILAAVISAVVAEAAFNAIIKKHSQINKISIIITFYDYKLKHKHKQLIKSNCLSNYSNIPLI